MGRKHKYSNRKRHKPCIFVGVVKKHLARTASVNVDNYLFEIKQEVVNELKTNAQREGNELCGVLMGAQVGDKHYRISKISPPCVKKHTRYGCERDAAMANQFIEEDYEQSEHTRFYIGEWHTHPENTPMPSALDCSSIKDIYQTASLVMPFLFMIIVGLNCFHICVYNGKVFKKIEPKIV
jgi:integrative and conjugative element protein (TIGR02256 family)